MAMLSNECAAHAIVQRLFRASMEVHSALSLVREESTAVLLRDAISQLDDSITQVQNRALALSQPGPRQMPVNALRRPRTHALQLVARTVLR